MVKRCFFIFFVCFSPLGADALSSLASALKELSRTRLKKTLKVYMLPVERELGRVKQERVEEEKRKFANLFPKEEYKDVSEFLYQRDDLLERIAGSGALSAIFKNKDKRQEEKLKKEFAKLFDGYDEYDDIKEAVNKLVKAEDKEIEDFIKRFGGESSRKFMKERFPFV